ncbi:YdgH/BhsA/McbA-like domain containing protein [Pantoea sp. UBA4549]|uniref:YdgH/BhsA/McbA-like domain containing protein n=1 Tax=Pantoea sp. UBA4549 TaxID=1947033 RepID=UPI0025FAF4F6|nr:YdgH/BhsA/McbA-like domain containing protein [Pantoea sp. UBA4549]
MKALINDVISIFTPQDVQPVLVRADLTPQQIASLRPTSVTSVSWATSMDELTDAVVKKALAAGAAGYHISDVESHEPAHDGHPVLAAKATLYHIGDDIALNG